MAMGYLQPIESPNSAITALQKPNFNRRPEQMSPL